LLVNKILYKVWALQSAGGLSRARSWLYYTTWLYATI